MREQPLLYMLLSQYALLLLYWLQTYITLNISTGPHNVSKCLVRDSNSICECQT